MVERLLVALVASAFLPAAVGQRASCLSEPADCRARALAVLDSEALFQGASLHLEFDPKEKLEAEKEAKVGDKFPPLGDLWDQVKDTTSSITDSVGEVVHDASQEVGDVADSVKTAANGVAERLAQALNAVLTHIKVEAESLLKETTKEKQEFMEQLNNTVLTAQDKILPKFAATVDKTLSGVMEQWRSLKKVVEQATSTVTSAFKAAGQGKLGKSLEEAVESAQQYIDSFVNKLKDANLDLQDGAKRLEVAKAGAMLNRVNEKLNEALQHISQFIMQFQQAFQDLIDTVSNAIIWSSEDVDESFASVQHNVTSIAWRVRSASRELVLSLHSGIVSVAKAENLPTPSWHPVNMPVLQSKAGSPMGLLVGVALALSTAVASLR